MKKHLRTLGAMASMRARSLAARLFSRHEIRSTLVALALSAVLPVADAQSSSDLSDLGAATNVVCMISSYISGPWLYAIGIILIIIGAVAIANSESTIGKMVSSVFVGLGLAAVAVPIVKNHLQINYTCT